ncbi:hypothetical protein EF294_03550 [Gordonia oryzae]|uniref:Uncharacterized protein n=1 Tax=Gordonia oryzae TaxID=2487349 RepID=A0A3N4HFX9_9ACTN|nr:hypothetical protein [Gordonia oryzae]RPA65824.1 hypothetical protein EF294_03550 [Gordonia oryzae]
MTAQAKLLAHESARWLSVLLLGLAAVLILGGQQRVSGPSYKFVHDLGGSDVWGLLFFAGAFAVAIASLKWPRALKWALRLAAVSFLLFALAGIGAAIASPIAGLTGIVVYLWLACWVVWVAAGVDDVR